MRILVDCDGPLSDFIATYLHLHRELNGQVRHKHDVTNFDFAKCVSTKDEDEKIWRHIDATKGIVRHIPYECGSIAGLDQLRKLGRVVCVTSPHFGPTWMPERAEWLIDRGFHKRDIVFRKDKAHEPGDVLIDDKPEHCREWLAENPKGIALLYGMPHNRADFKVLEHPRYWIVDNWDDVIHSVRCIKEPA